MVLTDPAPAPLRGGPQAPAEELEAPSDVLDLRVRSQPSQPPDQPRIAALLRLAQRGDGEAFGRIYDRYVDQVYRYLYYRLGSHALAEDLTSETFLRALRRIDSFSWEGRDIGAWFITIARNLVTDHVRSSRFRLEVPTADMLDAERADDGIEEIVLDRLQNSVVLDAMRQLKAEQQECLILRFLQGMSLAETARVMDRSEGAIKQLQLRAIRTLARLLNRRDDLGVINDVAGSTSLTGVVGSAGPLAVNRRGDDS
jgi:RNA polymerase sigma-70 factor (ECF subfamily)